MHRATAASACDRAHILANPPWGTIWGVLGVLVAWHCWFASYNHDEIEHLHAAWLISVGQLPYRDFLEQHHPTLWFFAAPVVARFQSVEWLMFAARLFDALCLVSVLAVFKRLLQRLHPRVPWQFPTLLLVASFMFVRNTLEFRPDPLMNVAVYGGLLNWVAFLQEGRFRRAFAAGASFGVAVVVLQKAAVILGLVSISGLFLVGLRLWGRERIERLAMGTAVVLLAAAIPISALFLAMRRLGIFDDFWFWNYPFNRFFYMQAHLPQHFSVLRTIGLSILLDPVLWIAGAVGAFLCARELFHRDHLSARDECRLTLLWLALGYLAFLCLNRFPLDQYFIVLLPLLALLGAEALGFGREGRQAAMLKRSILCMPVILIALLLVYPGKSEQLKVQEFVLRRTTTDQAIFVPPAFNPIFRRDAAYFWYNGDVISRAYEDYCRGMGDCLSDKLALDERRWRGSPPAYVFLELPAYYPYRWSSRESSYRPTEMPRLWAREYTSALPKAPTVAGGSAPRQPRSGEPPRRRGASHRP